VNPQTATPRGIILTNTEQVMKKKTEIEEEKGVFDLIEGLTSVDPDQLADFERAMSEEVIPEVVKVIEKRRTLAAKSRHWQLKC
jgi:hypothetical protein